MDKDSLYKTQLAARLHDPIEKSLILMRTAEGHEAGTSQLLREQLGLTNLPGNILKAVKQADHWASAADRAAFPNRNDDGRYPRWQQVQFHQQPVISHPLTGQDFDIGKLTELEPEQAKALALAHQQRLIHSGDLRKTSLAFWRFGPQIDAPEIRSLWSQLPADTRVPDHSIFDHLDLTSALASCFAVDAEGPALLAVSLGPVQDFIASARTSSDLWAGSHLLSRLSWEAMRVVCEALGPEAVLFPRLRGIPQVDLWLREQCGLDPELFENAEWTRARSDANPLFAAALPNRFTAIVPASQVASLTQAIKDMVRSWVRDRGEAAYKKLLEAGGYENDPNLPGYTQIREQLAGFPEVHWAAVPFTLVDTDADGRVATDCPSLAEAMQPFYESGPPGYLGSLPWKLLSGGVKLEQGRFWRPNPGVLYPALHDLLERGLASAKSLRSFDQLRQDGWRDALDGEAEWLTTDRAQLSLPPGQRKDTLWARVADRKPAWAKKGEHLSALNSLKRLWPTLFVEEIRAFLNIDVSRFVVSTHTMAVATSLSNALQQQRPLPDSLAVVLYPPLIREAVPG